MLGGLNHVRYDSCGGMYVGRRVRMLVAYASAASPCTVQPIVRTACTLFLVIMLVRSIRSLVYHKTSSIFRVMPPSILTGGLRGSRSCAPGLIRKSAPAKSPASEFLFRWNGFITNSVLLGDISISLPRSREGNCGASSFRLSSALRPLLAGAGAGLLVDFTRPKLGDGAFVFRERAGEMRRKLLKPAGRDGMGRNRRGGVGLGKCGESFLTLGGV